MRLAPRLRAGVGFGQAEFSEELRESRLVADRVVKIYAHHIADKIHAERSGVEARERVLDWWASALDKEGKPRAEADRQAMYQRIRVRMTEELSTHPGSAVASYWLAAAPRAQGDLQAAWDAAQAGWVRAPLTADRGVSLRADLDRLVLRAIVPDRAKGSAQTAETLRVQWEQFKERWNK